MEDALVLIEAESVRRLTNGWHIAIRAQFVDASPARPWGVDYGLVLMDTNGQRLLGFDNSHAYDGASVEAPWDHEHRADAPGRAVRYDANDAWTLISDFWDRVDAYISAHQAKTGEVLGFSKKEALHDGHH